MPAIPSNVLQYIKEAASGTGLPENVVAAQNYVESDYGQNEGPSSAGAEGPWQFLPSTYSGLGFSTSTITDWPQSTQAYIDLMKTNLNNNHGNVRDALAAYNAGQGNLSAGYQYADQILSLAGQTGSLTVGNSGTGGGSSASSGGLLSFPSQITGFFSDADSFVNKLLWLANPSSWVRIGAFLVGIGLLLFAIHALIATGEGAPIFQMPNMVPVPV